LRRVERLLGQGVQVACPFRGNGVGERRAGEVDVRSAKGF